MKNNIKPLSIIIVMMIFTLFTGQISAQKSKTIEFHTSAQCGMCKNTIEEAMNFERGIQFEEHNEESVKNLVAELGYSAGEVNANQKAMNELPKCCQPGGHL